MLECGQIELDNNQLEHSSTTVVEMVGNKTAPGWEPNNYDMCKSGVVCKGLARSRFVNRNGE